jgi:serine/threonine protein kinase
MKPQRDILMAMILRLVNENSSSDLVPVGSNALIGQGAFGRVYRTYNALDQKYYAVKRIPIINTTSIKELRLLSSLDHPNISRYYNTWIDMDTHNDNQELVVSNKIEPILNIQMELYTNTLRDYLLHRSSPNQSLNLGLFLGIINGLEYLHINNILHRDLHPENILIDQHMIPKIGDFGMAIRSPDDISIDDHYYGIVLYMAPEYINHNQFTAASDIYALGTIYFEMVHHFTTDMERFITITQARNRAYTSTTFVYTKIIRRILRRDPTKRISLSRIRRLVTKRNSMPS